MSTINKKKESIKFKVIQNNFMVELSQKTE